MPTQDASDDRLVRLTTRNETVVSVMAFFEGVGVLVNRGLIDINLVGDMLSTPIILAWQAVEPHIMARRKAVQRDQIWDWFEYLYNRIQSLP
ncbi:MAG: DUF4760 domain-containing protein [Candidatus Thorarchaeota archaeon]|nr:MAG: DUF4760 domain-containing protein [Candidatus Thorarchaeota archaeon]